MVKGNASPGRGRRDDRRNYRRPGHDQAVLLRDSWKRAAKRIPRSENLQLEGRFVKFHGDYAISKNPKGLLYCREV